MIKITGCEDHKFCYIKIKDGEYDHSKDYYGDSVILDFDKDKNLLGIEFYEGVDIIVDEFGKNEMSNMRKK